MEKMSKYFLSEKDFTKKVEKIFYFAKIEHLFFDKSTVLKAQIAKMFIQMMNLPVDENEVVTASLIYSLRKNDDPTEIKRIQEEIYEDRKFFEELGFDTEFSKFTTQYNRIIEDEKRTNQSDILELIDQFGGMLMHRENRLAYSVEDAIDLLQNKNLAGKENRYLEDFILFVDVLENIKINEGLGVLTKFQKEINKLEKEDISSAVRIVYDLTDSIENAMYFNKTELFEDDINYFELLKMASRKTIELFEYNKQKDNEEE